MCHRLEAAAGRVRDERWGPRTLDVDVLWIDGVTVDEPDLQVPHPRMWERRFVLAPLRDLAPDLVAEAALDGRRRRTSSRSVRSTSWRPHREPVVLRGADHRPGRAGTSLARALATRRVGRGSARSAGATTWPEPLDGVDLLVIATPDAAVAEVAADVEPAPTHGRGPPGRLARARRARPPPAAGGAPPARRAARRRVGARPPASAPGSRVAGDPLAARRRRRPRRPLRSRWPTTTAPRYHAAAVIASNHLVALLGQVERVAAAVGVPLDAYLDLARATLDNVAALGPAAALTGPGGPGRRATVERHLARSSPDERRAYEAMADAARRLAQQARPDADVPARRASRADRDHRRRAAGVLDDERAGGARSGSCRRWATCTTATSR